MNSLDFQEGIIPGLNFINNYILKHCPEDFSFTSSSRFIILVKRDNDNYEEEIARLVVKDKKAFFFTNKNEKIFSEKDIFVEPNAYLYVFGEFIRYYFISMDKDIKQTHDDNSVYR